MANRTTSLIAYGRTSQGWRRGTIITGKNGKLKPGVMLLNGKETPYENGHYEVRYYDGGTTKHKNVGRNYAAACKTLSRFDTAVAANDSLVALGVAVPALAKIIHGDQTQIRHTIAELTPAFVEKYGQGSSDSIARYAIVANGFAAVLASRGKTYPDQIDEDDVLAYDRQLDKEGMMKCTRANRYGYVRCMLKYMGHDPNKVVSPEWHKKLKSKPKKEVETYSDEEIQRVIAVASPYHALVWQCFWQLGFRDEELAYLEWTNIDWQRKMALVRFKPAGSYPWNPKLSWKSKDSEERDVPISESLYQKLLAWREQHPKTRFVVGTSETPGHPGDRPNIKFLDALKSDWKLAGLNCGRCPGCQKKRGQCGRAKIKTFRSTYLTTMLGHCKNIRDVQKLAGHSSISTTEKYLRPASGKQLQDAVNAAFSG